MPRELFWLPRPYMGLAVREQSVVESLLKSLDLNRCADTIWKAKADVSLHLQVVWYAAATSRHLSWPPRPAPRMAGHPSLADPPLIPLQGQARVHREIRDSGARPQTCCSGQQQAMAESDPAPRCLHCLTCRLPPASDPSKKRGTGSGLHVRAEEQKRNNP